MGLSNLGRRDLTVVPSIAMEKHFPAYDPRRQRKWRGSGIRPGSVVLDNGLSPFSQDASKKDKNRREDLMTESITLYRSEFGQLSFLNVARNFVTHAFGSRA
jgi:hypothetical protein